MLDLDFQFLQSYSLGNISYESTNSGTTTRYIHYHLIALHLIFNKNSMKELSSEVAKIYRITLA